MSLANIVITHDRALISVDTRAAFMDEAEGFMSEDGRRERHSGKLWLFPHIGTAMTQRGDGYMTVMVRNLLESAFPHSFDDAVRLMPGILDLAYTNVLEIRKRDLGIETFPGAEVVLVGWSQSRLTFGGVRWRRYPTDPDFIQSRVEGMLLMPEIDRIEPVKLPDTAEKMEALARRQIAWVRREHPTLADSCGGRLLLAELTQEALTVRTIADLER